MYRLRCKFCGMYLEPEEVCQCKEKNARRHHSHKRSTPNINLQDPLYHGQKGIANE